MSLFICDACHNIIENERIVESCPSCHSKYLIISSGEDKRLIVPAVRRSTDKEAGAYRQITEAKDNTNDLKQRIEKLKSYNLLDSEHNLALMLLWL